jgi:Ca2+-transporting ATPase
MQRAFHLQMLDLRAWAIVLSLGLVPLLLNEFLKIFIRVRMKKAAGLLKTNQPIR